MGGCGESFLWKLGCVDCFCSLPLSLFLFSSSVSPPEVHVRFSMLGAVHIIPVLVQVTQRALQCSASLPSCTCKCVCVCVREREREREREGELCVAFV